MAYNRGILTYNLPSRTYQTVHTIVVVFYFDEETIDSWCLENSVSSPNLRLVLVVLLREYCSLLLPLVVALAVLLLAFLHLLDREDLW